jgi:sucrose-6-phosphate hydrolase SacC (GH32 family)
MIGLLSPLLCATQGREYCPTFEHNPLEPHDVASCLLPNGTMAPCGPGNQMCPPGPFGRNTPQYHVRDLSCAENDPNGPVYDPVHGVYHLHYQNHVGCRGGRTYGHAVSRDFVHWAHMPVSIWNDHPYDEHAIYTGSATIVDGKVVQVYPGLCYPQFSDDCPGGTNLAIAVPADPSDPLQTNWSKDTFATNPIVNNTGRDPSTAWKTPDGEWRLTTFDTIIMGSMDFKTWYRIGKQPGFPVGECPSFFTLPRTTPGAGPAPAGAVTPTHVHKASHDGKDWMQVGTYVAGPPKSNGNWTALLDEVKIDAGHFYASKDFYDPVKRRRINWGWAQVPPASTQTLPREVTWHPELQQLVYSPVEEQEQLRGAVIGSLQSRVIAANATTALELPAQLGNQSEVRVSFERPAAAVRLSVNVMVDAARSAKGVEFFIDYQPGAAKVTVGSGGTTDMLSLLAGDKTIDLALFVDNTFTEVFWMNGRVAMTVDTKTSGGQDDVTISASQAGVTASATVWQVGSIWVDPEVVKQTPRRDSSLMGAVVED